MSSQSKNEIGLFGIWIELLNTKWIFEVGSLSGALV